MENAELLRQNRQSWNAIADDWFGATALPVYGPLIPTEDTLHLFGDVTGKRMLDIGCGSGHSLLYHAAHGAAELWGLDLSDRQLENAGRLLRERGVEPRLFCSPMEADPGLPKGYFDFVYSIYAVGWSTDLEKTFRLIASYLRPGGAFIFSWDHPILPRIELEGEKLLFAGSYHEEDLFAFDKGGAPVGLYNWKLSTYVNALAKAGLSVERLVEETDLEALACAEEFSSAYYAPAKARKIPLAFIIKAIKR